LGDRVPVGDRNFPPHHRVQIGSRIHQPPIQWEPGALSLVVKLPGREADHSPPSGAKVKNSWSYTSTPRYAFMARCSVKEQGS
jgi:hypothetical protein